MSKQLVNISEKSLAQMEGFLKLFPENWRGPVVIGLMTTSLVSAISPIVKKLIDQRERTQVVGHGHIKDQPIDIVDIIAAESIAA